MILSFIFIIIVIMNEEYLEAYNWRINWRI